MKARRKTLQKIIDFITFPIRSFTLIEDNKFGLSSLASERFDYVSREIKGRCLDVGCGRKNKFINDYLDKNGKGIDVFPYRGLKSENIINDLTKFPFPDNSFDCATIIATVNHIPTSKRDAELKEIYRCLKPDARIIITMGNPLAEITIHKILAFYTKVFKNYADIDSERGMDEEENYYLSDSEIISRLKKAGFRNIKKTYFLTQWFLNHMFIAEK